MYLQGKFKKYREKYKKKFYVVSKWITINFLI